MTTSLDQRVIARLVREGLLDVRNVGAATGLAGWQPPLRPVTETPPSRALLDLRDEDDR